MTPTLLTQIHTVTEELPPLALSGFINLLGSSSVVDEQLQERLMNELPNANFRRAALELITIWKRDAPHLSRQAIALALQSAAYASVQARAALSAEIVWTGPDTSEIPVRRTEQVLLQLIQDSQQELTVVSFAVYNVPEIARALIAAMDRQVQVRIIAETLGEGAGRVPFGVLAGLGAEVASRAQVYVWERAKRTRDAEGRVGSLHMKCALSDRKDLFISSANLTGYALTLNMEMGLLVHSQALAAQVDDHINALIYRKVLEPVDKGNS
jgi:phosphatidylserine/phosphatidylglycerophosphate/cardiolipin synthase-like enzyme